VAVAQTITVNKATTTQVDMPADNGFIPAIDQVLVPMFMDQAR
jgi:uncharacterized surface protein with fasciclin (FAS1) repeats